MILLHRLIAENFKQFEKIDITFPESGTILIEGNNESGKSSLFEAVFFALYGDGLGEIKDAELIRYGAESVEVTLEFSVEGRRFTITRRQGGKQKATFIIPQEDGETKTIGTLNPANQAIIAELGLSPQSLLNTCFVEQKQLAHLESLKPDKREEAINELVNLKALNTLDSNLPRKVDEDRRVTSCQRRFKIAELDARYADLEREWKRLQAVAAVSLLRDIEHRRNESLSHKDFLTTQVAETEHAITLHTRRDSLENLRRGPLTLWHTAETRVTEAQSAVTESETAQNSLPDLTRHAIEAETLQQRLALLLKIEAEDAQYAKWQTRNAEAEQAVAKTRAAQEDVETTRKHTRHALKTATERDALLAWVTARRAWEILQNVAPDPQEQQLEAALQTANATRDQLQQAAETTHAQATAAETEATQFTAQTRAEIARLQESLKTPSQPASSPPPIPNTQHPIPTPIPAYAIAGTGILLSVLGPALNLIPLLTIGVALLIVGIALAVRAMQAGKAAQLQAQEAEQARLRQEAEHLRAEQTRHNDVQSKIAHLQQQSAECQEAASRLRKTAQDSQNAAQKAAFDAERAEARLREYRIATDSTERRNNAQRQLRDAEARFPELSLPLPTSIAEAEQQAQTRDQSLPNPGATVSALKTAATEADHAWEAAQKRYQEALKNLIPYAASFTIDEGDRATVTTIREDLKTANLPTEANALATIVQQRRDARRDAANLADKLSERQDTLLKARTAAQTRRNAFATAWKELTGDALPDDQTLTSAEQLADTYAADLTTEIGNLPSALTSLPLSRLRERKDTLVGELGKTNSTLHKLDQEETDPRQALNLPTETTLADLLPALLEQHPDAATHTPDHWRAERDSARDECLGNRRERKGLADVAGVSEERLDRETAERELEDALFSRDTTAAARDILKRTRTAILERIMPGTELYVQRILPRLTDDRYRDIRWIAEDNRIEVLDSKKGAYVAKRVFSGGARDQISLALRLAFALTTLPTGRAVRPGWLFLDEPLSAFDATRTQSLIQLLTGKNALLRKQFAQIFLVSHSKSFDPNTFDHRIEMSEGKIATTTLPGV